MSRQPTQGKVATPKIRQSPPKREPKVEKVEKKEEPVRPVVKNPGAGVM